MDIVSHALWAGAAGEWLRRRGHKPLRILLWTVLLGIAPDIVPVVPVVAWSIFQPAPLQLLFAYVTAIPGTEPPLPIAIGAVSHHLHCAMHSIVIAGAVTALAWWRAPWLSIPLAGWWLHIAIDIPTHSTEYYAVPFLYPVSDWTVSGIAWTTPWVLLLNYAAIAAVYAALAWKRFRRRSSRAGN